MTQKSQLWIIAQGFAVSLGISAWMPVIAQATPEAPVEEVVATGVDRCGPWPLFHRSSLWGCEFAVLRERELATLQTLREQLVDSCLACAEGTCRPKTWTVDTMEERQARKACERLFLTPREIYPLRKLRNSISELQPLYVNFTYTVSRDGKVTDIRIPNMDRRSRVTNRESLRLIKDGARSVLFEPLVIDGLQLEINRVADRYLLDGN